MNKGAVRRFLKNKWLKQAAQLIVIITCSVFIYQNLKQIDLRSVKLDYWFIFLSLLFTLLGTYLGALSWWMTLRSFEKKLLYDKACDIQFKSNLAKYLPGYGWQLVGKGYMSIENGLSTASVGTAMFFEYAEIFFTGSFLAALVLPPSLRDFINNEGVSDNALLLIRIIVFLLAVSGPFWIKAVTKLFNKKNLGVNLDLKWVALLSLLLLIVWIINSSGFYFLVTATGFQSGIDFRSIVFILTVTFLAGLVVIFVPGSLGIREALFVFWLAPFVIASSSGLIAITYRIITISSEVLIFLFNNLWHSMADKKRLKY